MPILIEFNVNNIASAKDNAVIMNGENQVFGWSSPLKQNNMMAPVGAFLTYPANFNLIFDNDLADIDVIHPRWMFGGSFQQV
ncbi:hypothetical protein JOD45_002772 [Scopulibacillus daqui]|uniref:Uncharacterized protein n=1 Tax=Scopulibacillus daqui TaxID=1469162 RepID=A0ABS2Q2L6_9BACL|nr:hypothetical protein [Scopulibacillus daqui]MBM7646542.1 hypothetical protein [Scopulibacillus daqui]